MSVEEVAVTNARLVFDFLRPKASPFPLVRLGGSGDGAYLVPDDFSGVSDCFSPGVGTFKDFEDELLLTYGVRSHLMDFSAEPDNLKTRMVAGHQTFEKKWLAAKTGGDNVSLESWVNEHSSPDTLDLILQMDIEGAEFDILNSLRPELLRKFRILVIELHGLGKLFNTPEGLENILVPLVRQLGHDHVSVYAHPNNCCGEARVPGLQVKIPNILEVTFLRKDRFELTNITAHYPPEVPHPLEINKNVDNRPFLSLSRGWSSQPPLRASFLLCRQLFLDLLDSRVPRKRLFKKYLDPVYLRLRMGAGRSRSRRPDGKV